MAAPALANYLYGTKDPSELTQDQKDTITNILNLATVTTAYTATDGNTTDAVSAAEVGKVAIENNANIFVNGHWNAILHRAGISPPGSGKENYWEWMGGISFIPKTKEFLNSEAEKDSFIDGSSFMGIDQDGLIDLIEVTKKSIIISISMNRF